MPAIEIRKISKKFKVYGNEFYALKDVSIDIKEGEIFSLIGPNGSGKTTLINIILGLLIPDTGYVKILGKRVEDESSLEKMNFVSPEERFHWVLSANDTLNIMGKIYGLDRATRKKRITGLVELFGLGNVLNRRFDGLSTGEKMRLALAKALLNEPQILLLDEPTLGLDPDISIKIREEIKRINKSYGTTILLTSHYMKEVEQLADRVAFIKNGKIVQVGKTNMIRKKGQSLEEYFVEKVEEG
ncbi:MAG: ABC transporter ATP-binding protein [Candidatus Aenigmarchaeota archaeon]|nr:ABC transporter ATP-binding protein [Candidatus Aenigmarchaeota archaeon]